MKPPGILIVATESLASLSELFSKRGFTATEVKSALDVSRQYRGEVPVAAIVDFECAHADLVLKALGVKRPPLVILGICAKDGSHAAEDRLDALFERPVDPARLFAALVRLISGRRAAGKGTRKGARITGVVALVSGNELFELTERQLHAAVPPLNAAAILEKAITDMGSHPSTLTRAELAAMVASGRLLDALLPFGKREEVVAAIDGLAILLD